MAGAAYGDGVAADVTAIILTVACAAVAACCALLLQRLWRAGRIAQPTPPDDRNTGDQARRP